MVMKNFYFRFDISKNMYFCLDVGFSFFVDFDFCWVCFFLVFTGSSFFTVDKFGAFSFWQK